MTREAHETYLETQITTATPQQLRLMLIDGAIRFARQTQDQWRMQQQEAALESLIRCREIVSELIAGVRPDESPLAQQVTALYGYLFSALTEAQQTRDATQLAAVIRVLEDDRETWRQVCEQLAERPVPAPNAAFPVREEVAPAIVASPATTFSIEA
jgi:flagellar protein FliS